MKIDPNSYPTRQDAIWPENSLSIDDAKKVWSPSLASSKMETKYTDVLDGATCMWTTSKNMRCTKYEFKSNVNVTCFIIVIVTLFVVCGVVVHFLSRSHSVCAVISEHNR